MYMVKEVLLTLVIYYIVHVNIFISINLPHQSPSSTSREEKS